MSKEYRANPKHLRIIHRPNPVSTPLEPDPYKPSNPIKRSEKKWSPISKIQNVSDDEDSDSEEEIIESFATRNDIEDLVGEQNVIEEREDETFPPEMDRETEEDSRKFSFQ